jgi:hypothetical protein
VSDDESHVDHLLPYVTLTYFFWLPGGKDEFGFKDYEDAPLGRTAFYRTLTPLEDTISRHFQKKVDALTDADDLAFMRVIDTLQPDDAELGLRKIQFNFTYRHNYPDLKPYVRTESIPGTAVFLSNGLYLWSFRVPLRNDMSTLTSSESSGLKDALKGFLRDDFLARHVKRLMDFGWNPDLVNGTPDGYEGIMTFYQLDLLFNGVLDPSAHPHLALGNKTPEQVARTRDHEAAARERYSVRYLIESLSMYALGTEYRPLVGKRKDYSLRRTQGDQLAYIDSAVNLEERQLRADDEEGLHARELFLSRVSFAAMEQFLRVAISFGLAHYKTGLDHIRAELVSQGMQTRRNAPSSELRRASLRFNVVSLTDLETYHALLAGKIPVLFFLLDLITDLSEVTNPSREVEANGVVGAVEWKFSRKTLAEALMQFERMVKAIRADREAIQSSLEAARTELMLLEMTEQRKLSEIAAETPPARVELAGRSVATLDRKQLEAITLVFAFVGILIGVLDAFSNVGVWFLSESYGASLTPTQSARIGTAAYWTVGLIVIGYAFYKGRTFILRVVEPKEAADDPTAEAPDDGKHETHVYDYSSLLRDVEAESHRSLPAMKQLKDRMVDISDPALTVRCASFSTFHETPSSGIERIKYSLDSGPIRPGLSYVLHVEFDKRLSGEAKERLLDVRLVVRRSASVDLDVDEIDRNSHEVIANCVKLLLFPRGSDSDVKEFCQERFGWTPLLSRTT